ncbi:MAG: hypothetical protein E7306_02995 [Butyrivibrio sp.]|nr:hypothetical protein [Butyrivibrio sp.]
MITTKLYNLQKRNPRTFAVMLTKRQRKAVSEYLKDINEDFHPSNGELYYNLSRKLETGHMSYNDTELSIMRAAIQLNRFIQPISFICRKYLLYATR